MRKPHVSGTPLFHHRGHRNIFLKTGIKGEYLVEADQLCAAEMLHIYVYVWNFEG